MTIFHSTYQPAAAEEALTNWGAAESSRVYSGTLSYTEGGSAAGMAEREGASYNHTIDGHAGDPVMATLAYSGTAQTVELEPGNPASRTTVAAAVKMGLIRPRLGGGYEDVTNQAQAREAALAEPKEVPVVDPGAGLFSESEDRAYAQLIDPLPQHAYDGAMAVMVGAVARGLGTQEDAAAKLSEVAGVEPGQAAEMVAAAHSHYSRVVARALAPMGLAGDSLEAAYAHMQAHEPARLQDAIQRLTHGRDVSGFQALAKGYLLSGAKR
jgi:hypothetical protein